jgi:hypothetical protein
MAASFQSRMTKAEKVIIAISWVLAVLGGGWAILTILSAYMTTTGYIQSEDVIKALPLPLGGIFLALAAHLWPPRRPWYWFVPVYLVAGGPVLLLVMTWLGQL